VRVAGESGVIGWQGSRLAFWRRTHGETRPRDNLERATQKGLGPPAPLDGGSA